MRTIVYVRKSDFGWKCVIERESKQFVRWWGPHEKEPSASRVLRVFLEQPSYWVEFNQEPRQRRLL